MAITALILLVLYAGLAALLSRWADRRFARRARLPMQWSPAGVNWTAPRRLALILVPALSGAGVIACAVGAVVAPDRLNVSEANAARVFILVATLGLGIYGLWLWLVARWDRAAPL